MELSRSKRRHDLAKKTLRQLMFALLLVAVCAITVYFWYLGNQLAVTTLLVVIFFGILTINPWHIRRVIPGLSSSRRKIRGIMIFLYLLGVIALISRCAMQ